MRKCPKCKKVYDESWEVCLTCGVSLVEDITDRLERLEEQAKQIIKEVNDIRNGKIDSSPAEKPVEKPESSQIKKEDTETQIGKYVLNKVGIVSIVAGVTFFISYAFQYMAPVFRIAIGYVISALLIYLGVKADKTEKYRWYGRGLIAGGWVLAYFATFAMYHIEPTRIISSQALDLSLLLVVIVVMTTHLYRYKSQSLIGLVMVLGYVTAGISSYASFSFIYLMLLAMVSVILLHKQNWRFVALFSLFGTYLTHVLWLRLFSKAVSTPQEFWISVSFGVMYWLIYNVVPFILNTVEEKNKSLASGFLLVNSLLFGIVTFLQVQAYEPGLKLYFALMPALLMGGLAVLAGSTKDKSYLKASFTVAAIVFATISLRYMLGEPWVDVLWFVEIPLLLLVGFRFKDGIYRIAAWGLSFVMVCRMAVFFGYPERVMFFGGREIPVTFIVYLVGGITFYFARLVYIYNSRILKGKSKEPDFSQLYTILGTIILLLVSFYEIQDQFVTAVWAIIALFLFIAGFILKDKFFRYSAIGVVLMSIFRILIIDLAGANNIFRILVFLILGVILLLTSLWYAKMSSEFIDKDLTRGTKDIVYSTLVMIVIIPMVFGVAILNPSEYRLEDKLRVREGELSANFIAGKTLSSEDINFLNEREFKVLVQTLRALRLKRDNDVYKTYMRVLELGVVSKVLYFNLARVYVRGKEWPAAIEMFEKGLLLDPDRKEWDTKYALRSVAQVYQTSGNYQNAVKYYEEDMIYHKNNIEVVYNLAVCYERLGELDKSLELLNDAMRMDKGGTYAPAISSLESDIYGKKPVLKEK